MGARQERTHGFSLILSAFKLVYVISWLVAPIRWFECAYERPESGRRLPFLVVELWVFAKLSALTLVLTFSPRDSRITLFLGIWALVESANALLRESVWTPSGTSVIRIRDASRWLMMGLANVVEVIMGFALIYFSFTTAIDGLESRLDAIYFSIVTFTTLGYGEMKPATDLGKVLVVMELLFFLGFLVLRVPLAVSALTITTDEG